MHTIKIAYAEQDDPVETTVDDVPSAVHWLVENLGDWCIDEDIEIQLDGIILWPR